MARPGWEWLLLVCLAGCQWVTPGAAVEVAGPDGEPTLVPGRGQAAWVVRVRETTRDCAPDAASCDERFEASADGSWLRFRAPHPLARAKEASVSRKRLSASELAELRTIVEAADFQRAMHAGFPCQGAGNAGDWSLRITLLGGDGEGPRSQRAERCLTGEEANLPRRLTQILAR